MYKRILIGIIGGAILGVVCIIGATLRSSDVLSANYLFAFWFNRVIIGLVVGLLPKSSLKVMLVQGIVIGTLVSFAFYSSTNYQDLMGFLAGVVYGALIALALNYFDKKQAHI